MSWMSICFVFEEHALHLYNKELPVVLLSEPQELLVGAPVYAVL